ncbi:PLC-like phosphodiesterase [Daedalea quercina L-15889]|uniref:PLC-like phosphodiesterase n=1 Tax=Daedalea quercina L-15889 TaxID=1314783 RepID=A0A165R1T6_9APHY|nr:PLC-like phosphodiesterase [Daedalea quercina L-15889]
MSLGAVWKVVKVPEECPWGVYRCKVSRKHHLLLILPRRDLASFLSDFPDSLPLSSMLLPGTHDTMAFYGWPISQCQSFSTPLAVQLQSGIRVIDIRLAIINNRLIAYHGLYPQREPFQSILSSIFDFLTSPKTCRETIVMSIKQEDFAYTSEDLFSQLVHDEIMNGPGGRDMWFLDNRVPTLGEARGKVVMLSRFGGDGAGWDRGLEGMGIHPTAWPDSAKNGFTWQCKNTLVRTQDWYNIPSFLSIPEKTELGTKTLLPPENDPGFPTLSISYFSASSVPLAFPPTIARGFGWPKLGLGVEGVNGRLGTWLIDMLSSGSAGHQGNARASKGGEQSSKVRIRGWALLDFYRDPEDNAIVPLLVECNYRGRRSGEEGWP